MLVQVQDIVYCHLSSRSGIVHDLMGAMAGSPDLSVHYAQLHSSIVESLEGGGLTSGSVAYFAIERPPVPCEKLLLVRLEKPQNFGSPPSLTTIVLFHFYSTDAESVQNDATLRRSLIRSTLADELNELLDVTEIVDRLNVELATKSQPPV